MIDKILLVSSPDDVQIDGLRILFIDLDDSQGSIISQALSELDFNQTIIAYSWKNGNPLDWLFDKKHKSQIIIFNADSLNQIIVGYMAAQKNSYYFGTLRDLSGVNKSAIFDSTNCKEIFERYMKL